MTLKERKLLLLTAEAVAKLTGNETIVTAITGVVVEWKSLPPGVEPLKDQEWLGTYKLNPKRRR